MHNKQNTQRQLLWHAKCVSEVLIGMLQHYGGIYGPGSCALTKLILIVIAVLHYYTFNCHGLLTLGLNVLVNLDLKSHSQNPFKLPYYLYFYKLKHIFI